MHITYIQLFSTLSRMQLSVPDSDLTDFGLVGAALILLYFALKIIYSLVNSRNQDDASQNAIVTQLTRLADRAIEEGSLNRVALEGVNTVLKDAISTLVLMKQDIETSINHNTQDIQALRSSFTNMQDSFCMQIEEVSEQATIIGSLLNRLIENPVKVRITSASGEAFGEYEIRPDVSNGSVQFIFVVTKTT